MQLMTFISAYLFASVAEQGAEKPLQKISYNLGNISNVLSVTWLCDWKEHFIWRFAIFWSYWHYTVTFPVIYHIVEYQDKFASPYIYHITGKYRDRFSQLLYTKWCTLLAGDVQHLFKRDLQTDSAPGGFSPHLLWNWDFRVNYSTTFRKEELRPICFLQQVHRVNWEWRCCRGTPFSLGIWKQWCQDGAFRHEAREEC